MTSEKSTLDTIKGYLFPYHRCAYLSILAPEEILTRIQQRTEPEQFFRFSGWLSGNKKTKMFEGVVGQSEFKINKILKKKNSYTPVITGRLTTSNQYTKVSLMLRLSYFQIIFYPTWLLFVLNFIFKDFYALSNVDLQNFSNWIPLLFIIAFYLIMSVSFGYNVNKVKKSIEQILEPVDDVSPNSSGASWIIRN